MNAEAQEAERTAVRNLLLQGELFRIVDALERQRIPVVVLKGVPLARRLGVSLATRRILDNDILVHRADAERAVSLLAALGYRSLPHSDLQANLKYRSHEAMVARRHGLTVVAELHWQAFTPALFRVEEGLLWEHTERFELDGQSLLVFDRALTVVHLAAHYLQHGFQEPRILGDFSRAWEAFGTSIDWRSLEQLAFRTDCIAAMDFAWATARDWGLLGASVEAPTFGSRRASLVRHLLRNAELRQPTHPRDYSRSVPSLLLGNPRSVAVAVKRWVFPPFDLMPSIYGETPSFRLWARYLTRPGRPLARALGFKVD